MRYDTIDLNQTELKNARLHGLASAPPNPVPGQIYHNSVSEITFIYNGTDWVDIMKQGTITELSASAPLVSSGGEAPSISLADSGVIPGSYSKVTVSAQGLVIAGSNSDEKNEDTLDVTSPKWGADPTGKEDSGAKINAAIQYAHDNNNKKVFIPSGTYALEVPIEPRSGLEIIGAGISTILKIKDSTDISGIKTMGQVFNFRLSDFTIDGNKQNNNFANGGDGLNLHMSSSHINRLRFKNISKVAMRICDDGDLYDDTSYLNRIYDNEIEDSHIGIRWGSRCADSWCERNNVSSTYANLLLQGGSCRFMANHFNGSPEYNVYVECGNTFVLDNNIIENAGKYAIYSKRLGWEEASKYFKITNNIIRDSSHSENGAYDLIRFEGYSNTTKANNILIQNNLIISTNGNKPRYAISLENCSDVSIVGNTFTDGFANANPIEIYNVDNLKIEGNLPTNGITDLNPHGPGAGTEIDMRISKNLAIFPDEYAGIQSPYNFATITGVRGGVEFTEMWLLINARYDYETKRFKRIDVNNFSFGWQYQGGGTYPGEEIIGDTINQGMCLWKANGKKAFSANDPARDLITEDIGALQPDGTWREFGIIMGWNNHFMCDSYGGMTIGGAGFEIDGSGTSPFSRVSLGKFSGGSSDPNRPVTDYGFTYNGTCWNTQHGMWNKDEDQLPGYFYGFTSPVNFYDQGDTVNVGSNRADMDDVKFIVKRLGNYVRPYIENWHDIFEVNQDGEMKLRSWEVVDSKTINFNPEGKNFIIIPFPDSSWNKNNMIINDLEGTTTYYKEMLRNRKHTWVPEGLKIDLDFTYYTDVKVKIQKILITTMGLHPRKGMTTNGSPDKATIQVDLIKGSTDFNANFPDDSWNKDNTIVLAVIGKLADGNTRQLGTNVTMTPYGMYGGLGTNEYVSAKVILSKI
ncbi:glycosyl hydrolase family 28-related protein [Paenibacillus sp. FSL K6-2524]|uniref:glycosyl hydrolase family 28-related protein n=1 Tax=Paenibacillus sp. FSL K6-2524 TaxID=2954516 RepID=UPI0030F5D85B